MAPLVVHFRQDVEEEGLYVVVERLVVKEHLGDKAQVLAVNLAFSMRRGEPNLVFPPVHFEDGELPVAVNLVAGRPAKLAFDLRG